MPPGHAQNGTLHGAPATVQSGWWRGKGRWVQPQAVSRLRSSPQPRGRFGSSTERNRRQGTWCPFWPPQQLFHPSWPTVSCIGGGTAIPPTCRSGSTPPGWPHSSSIQASPVLCWSNSKVLTPHNCLLPPHLESLLSSYTFTCHGCLCSPCLQMRFLSHKVTITNTRGCWTPSGTAGSVLLVQQQACSPLSTWLASGFWQCWGRPSPPQHRRNITSQLWHV